MRIFFNILLVILMFLAIASGIAKISLTPHDVEFFGSYGFTEPVLITFGCVQLLGGILLAFPKSRITGAAVVATTFAVSAVMLLMAGKYTVTLITLLFILASGFIIKKSHDLKTHVTDEI